MPKLKNKVFDKPNITAKRPKADQSIAEVGSKHQITKSDAEYDHGPTVKSRKKEISSNEQIDSGSSNQVLLKTENYKNNLKLNGGNKLINSATHLKHSQIKSDFNSIADNEKVKPTEANKQSKKGSTFKVI